MDKLPEAADIRAMHAEDLGNVTRMLSAYLTQWMGGPLVYLALEQVGAIEQLKAMLHEPLRRLADAVRNSEDGGAKARSPDIIAVG